MVEIPTPKLYIYLLIVSWRSGQVVSNHKIVFVSILAYTELYLAFTLLQQNYRGV